MELRISVDFSQVTRFGRAVNAVSSRFPAELNRSFLPKRKARVTAVMGADAYPPELPNSDYERTGELGRSWDVALENVRGFNAELIISNDATDPRGKQYAAYVIGDLQAPIHQGRWFEADDEVQEMLDEIADDYRASYLATLTDTANEMRRR